MAYSPGLGFSCVINTAVKHVQRWTCASCRPGAAVHSQSFLAVTSIRNCCSSSSNSILSTRRARLHGTATPQHDDSSTFKLRLADSVLIELQRKSIPSPSSSRLQHISSSTRRKLHTSSSRTDKSRYRNISEKEIAADNPDFNSEITPLPGPGPAPRRMVEKYLQSPYPSQLFPIHDEHLRNEVFRLSRPNGLPSMHGLPHAYYHTAMEHCGDHLTRFIADEVCIHWSLQFCDTYPDVARWLNKHAYRPVTALIRNDHWTVLSRQFGIHGPARDASSETATTSARLADNFEAYIYALYLDQGIEKVYEFLCPIFLKKLYSQAKQLGIMIPHTSVKVEIDQEGKPVESSVFERFVDRVKQVIKPSSPHSRTRRVMYPGYALPDWEVPCTNGKHCSRDSCYFDHTGERLPRPHHAMARPPPSIAETVSAGAPLEAEVLLSDEQTGDEANTLREPPKIDIQTDWSSIDGPGARKIDKAQLEAGIFKRIDALLTSRLSRERHDIVTQVEKHLRKRTDELWTEKKQSRKAAIQELYSVLNDGPDALPSKINRAVAARVDMMLGKLVDQEQPKGIDKLQARIAELEERVAELELAYVSLEDAVCPQELKLLPDDASTASATSATPVELADDIAQEQSTNAASDRPVEAEQKEKKEKEPVTDEMQPRLLVANKDKSLRQQAAPRTSSLFENLADVRVDPQELSIGHAGVPTEQSRILEDARQSAASSRSENCQSESRQRHDPADVVATTFKPSVHPSLYI